MSAESFRVFLVSNCLLVSPLGQSLALTITLHAHQFTSLMEEKKKSIRFPSKKNYRAMIERIICSTVHLLPRIVFQMIPAAFTSPYTTSMTSLNELAIYFTVTLSCYKNTPLRGNSSALSFFLATTFFEKKRENKIILDSTMCKSKENRAWFLLPQKYFRSEKLCILVNESGQLRWDVKMT